MNLISHRKPSNLLAVVRTNGLTKVSGCACNKDKRVVQLLIKIDMPYAAGMHIKNQKNWTPQDWVPHIKEEDTKLFPILKTVAFTLSNQFEKEQLLDSVNQLIADHKDVIIPAIEANKLPSDEFAKKHGDLEDYLIRKYYYKILQVYNLASSDNSSFRIVGNKAGNIGIDQPTTVGVGISVDDLDLFKEKESSGLGLVLGAAIGSALMFVGAPILLAVAPLALITATSAVKAINKNSLKNIANAGLNTELCKSSNLSPVKLNGEITEETKKEITKIGLEAKAKFEKLKSDIKTYASTAGSVAGPLGSTLAVALTQLGFFLTKNEDWYTPEEEERVKQNRLTSLQYGIWPVEFDNDLDAGYSGWADRINYPINGIKHLPKETQDKWEAFVAWMYAQPEENWFPIGKPKKKNSLVTQHASGNPIPGFIRTDDELKSFGIAYARFVCAKNFQDRYGRQSVNIGKWLRKTEPFRFSTAEDYTKSIQVLLDNVDKESFGGVSSN